MNQKIVWESATTLTQAQGRVVCASSLPPLKVLPGQLSKVWYRPTQALLLRSMFTLLHHSKVLPRTHAELGQLVSGDTAVGHDDQLEALFMLLSTAHRP